MIVIDSQGERVDTTAEGYADVPQDPDSFADWIRRPGYMYAIKVYLAPDGVLYLTRDYSRGLAFGKMEDLW